MSALEYAVALVTPTPTLRGIPGALPPRSRYLPAPEVNRAAHSEAEVNVRQQVGDQGENGGRMLLTLLVEMSPGSAPLRFWSPSLLSRSLQGALLLRQQSYPHWDKSTA